MEKLTVFADLGSGFGGTGIPYQQGLSSVAWDWSVFSGLVRHLNSIMVLARDCKADLVFCILLS